MAFSVVTDSSCNLTEDIIDTFGIHVFPLTFMVDGEQFQSYLKGERTDLKQFYTMMRDGKVITTSLPKLDEATELVKGIFESGNDVLYLGFSSALSGTYEAMSSVIDDLASRYPDRIAICLDTFAASGGEGLLVWKAAEMALAGETLEATAKWVEDNRLHLAHWFTVDDLMFLFRGGRVSKTSAWAGTMLNIKPVMHVDDEGRLVPVAKVRGRKKALAALVDRMELSAMQPVADQRIFITHGDCAEDAEFVADLVRERFGATDITINYVDPVIGAHSGPGTMALFFLASER